MPFRFALSTLLRYRQSVEHQQKLLFQDALRQVALVQLHIDRTEQALAALSVNERSELTKGLTAAELQFNSLCREALLFRRDELNREMSRKKELRAQRRGAFLQAQRQREIVETLQQRQLQLYRQKENRAEQSRLDEAFLLRREFLRRG